MDPKQKNFLLWLAGTAVVVLVVVGVWRFADPKPGHAEVSSQSTSPEPIVTESVPELNTGQQLAVFQDQWLSSETDEKRGEVLQALKEYVRSRPELSPMARFRVVSGFLVGVGANDEAANMMSEKVRQMDMHLLELRTDLATTLLRGGRTDEGMGILESCHDMALQAMDESTSTVAYSHFLSAMDSVNERMANVLLDQDQLMQAATVLEETAQRISQSLLQTGPLAELSESARQRWQRRSMALHHRVGELRYLSDAASEAGNSYEMALNMMEGLPEDPSTLSLKFMLTFKAILMSDSENKMDELVGLVLEPEYHNTDWVSDTVQVLSQRINRGCRLNFYNEILQMEQGIGTVFGDSLGVAVADLEAQPCITQAAQAEGGIQVY